MTGRFAIGRLAVGACLLALPCAAWFPAGSAAAASTVHRQGYIRMVDGTQLEYSVALPSGRGRFPVALAYAGYCEGQNSLSCNDSVNAPALLAAGYAVLGVSIRGTSCSTGTFQAFTPQEWRDGAAAIQWAAQQPWSNGRLGMFGDSFPGITQLGVAGLRPKHLDAIAPFQVTTDLYRDVAVPGGIPNSGFGAFWGLGDQPSASYSSGFQQTVQANDGGCGQAQVTHLGDLPANNIFLQGMRHLWDDAYWRTRQPGANAARIDVPVLGCLTWQDDEVSSRGGLDLTNALNPARTWLVAGNGYHAGCEITAPSITHELVAFFNRFVKGVHNGFTNTPHVQIWHDAYTNGAGDNLPSWITRFRSVRAIPVRPLALYFRPGGELGLAAPTGQAQPERYAYPGPALGSEDGIVFGQHGLMWKGEEPPGASVSYTTPPLTHDVEFFGSGSANIWLSSTALPTAAGAGAGYPVGLSGVGADTDLQITLTEVRPDGQEVYVARGWLRASHRALDPARSTELAPYQADQQQGSRALVPGRPTYMRIQLWPFDYVFRKGSSVRLWIDAPTGETGGWSFDFIKTPAINSIYADGRHRSEIVLGYLPAGHAQAPMPACGTLLNQPCRPNAVPVPSGTMTIR